MEIYFGTDKIQFNSKSSNHGHKILIFLLTCCSGATIRILMGLSFLEINIFVGKMGEINKWPQGLVEIQPILSSR